MFPTAIGLYGSSWSGVAFLMDANSRAPQKKGATLRGKDPEDRALTKVCRALRHLIDLEETLEEMASFRCSGRRPEGPGAEPGLKEAMERETWSRVSCSAGADISPSGRVGGGTLGGFGQHLRPWGRGVLVDPPRGEGLHGPAVLPDFSEF